MAKLTDAFRDNDNPPKRYVESVKQLILMFILRNKERNRVLRKIQYLRRSK